MESGGWFTMYKRRILYLSCVMLIVITCSGCRNEKESEYKDGTYEAKTDIDGEGFYTEASVTVENGLIAKVDWTIYDSGNKRPFDETYEEVYVGNDHYIQQSRDDWKGSRKYSSDLIESQDLEEVDAVSGATWTNGKFKEAVGLALEKAKNW